MRVSTVLTSFCNANLPVLLTAERTAKFSVGQTRRDPILKRVGIVSSGWCDLIEQFGRLFKRAVGSPQSLADEAEARGQKYLQAPSVAAFISG